MKRHCITVWDYDMPCPEYLCFEHWVLEFSRTAPTTEKCVRIISFGAIPWC